MIASDPRAIDVGSRVGWALELRSHGHLALEGVVVELDAQMFGKSTATVEAWDGTRRAVEVDELTHLPKNPPPDLKSLDELGAEKKERDNPQ